MKKVRGVFLLGMVCLALQFLSVGVAHAEPDLTGVWIIEGEDPLDSWTYHYRFTDVGGEYLVEPFAPYKDNVNMTETLYLTVNGKRISGRIVFDWRGAFANGDVWTRNVRGLLDPSGDRLRLRYEAVGPAGATGNVAEGWAEYDQNRIFVRFE